MHGLIDMNLPNLVLQRDQLAGFRDRMEGIHRVFMSQFQKKSFFILEGWVTDRQAHQEAIQLCFREWKSAFVFDRVLGSDDQERPGQEVGYAIGSHLLFLHGLEKRGLGTWRRAIDFINQKDVYENRAWAKLEFAILLIENGHANDVVGEQVWRALQPFKLPSQADGQGAG